MALYLDIDLDYFVRPVQQSAITNIRKYKHSPCTLTDPAYLEQILAEKGITLGPKRYAFTNHMQSYLFWRLAKSRGNTVIHLDAHSDLYGHRQVSLSALPPLGCQNYLWHAIRENLVREIYWVTPPGLLDLAAFDPRQSFSPEQITSVHVTASGITIDLKQILGDTKRDIKYRILTAEELPVFNQPAEIITLATSPEFIPAAADRLIRPVCTLLGIPPEKAAQLWQTHQAMPD